MPAKKRIQVKGYRGVYYIDGTSGSGKPEKIYYIRYRKAGKMIEEKAGRQFADDMTPSRAASVRGQRIDGKQVSNTEKRSLQDAERKALEGKWTVGKLWTEYKSHRPDSKNLRTDQSRYNLYLKEAFGKNEPHEIGQLQIDRLRITLLKKKSPQTVKHVLGLLKRIINFGKDKGLADGLKFKIQMPTVNNQKTEDLTPEQLEKLLKVLGDSSNVDVAGMMKMALFTGMRKGELFKLQWQDVDFERGFIHIRDPKGGEDQKIPLNDAAKEFLENHPRSKSPFVFPGKDGEQRASMQQGVNKIRKDAGLPKDFRPMHGLRHVFASMLASSGQVDIYTLQRLLTHKSPVMTQRYAHLRDDTLKRASNVAGDIITLAVKDSSNVVDLKSK